MKYISILFILVIGLVQCKSNDGTESEINNLVIDDHTKTSINETLSGFVENGKIAGVSALVFEDGKEVYFGAFGKADREADLPMQRNTIVQIYSMTKPITGVALMTLYEEGKFNLDDPLEKYLPEFKGVQVCKEVDEKGDCILEDPKRLLTIRDLTRHTSGLANNVNRPGTGPLLAAVDIRNPENTLADVSRKYASLPLEFHPGDQWYYGPSVDIQAYLVEKISGIPFDAYLEKIIFEPLEMNETRYLVSEESLPRLAAVYRRSVESDAYDLTRVPDENIHKFNTKDWNLTPGGWGLTSTIDDYMKFAQMLVNKGSFDGNQILKPETVGLMATNHLDESIEERSWLPSKGRVGFGIDFAVRLYPPADDKENYGVVGEFFWDGAASTLFWVDPINKLTAVLFVQLMPFDGIGLHKAFRDAVYGPVRTD
jgi:CubicO group peptidase (beta-lactamase class C family)